jgi:uncharacterized protein
MKYTVCLTQQCNLRCSYCYINKKESKLSIETAKHIIDFVFKNTPAYEKIELGYFGGEPLLEIELMKKITQIIEEHSLYNKEQIQISLVTNGTLYNDEIGQFINEHNIIYCVSCDGPDYVQDSFRCFQDGTGSSSTVSKNIQQAIKELPFVLVNSVYNPTTIEYLPEVVNYFINLGIKQVYLSPDISAKWSLNDTKIISEVFQRVAWKYIDQYVTGDPIFISLIDSKIALILRGGYKPLERCRMGKGEFAFAPSGNIYPCERLIGSDDGINHCIGNIYTGLNYINMICHKIGDQEYNTECSSCSLKQYCMNWCGCTNFFTSGFYNRVSPFFCFLERTSIETAFNTYKVLEGKFGSLFMDHIAGNPELNSLKRN